MKESNKNIPKAEYRETDLITKKAKFLDKESDMCLNKKICLFFLHIFCAIFTFFPSLLLYVHKLERYDSLFGFLSFLLFMISYMILFGYLINYNERKEEGEKYSLKQFQIRAILLGLFLLITNTYLFAILLQIQLAD